MSITATVDLRHLFGPARDQGPRPTCLAFAASDLHAALREGWSTLSCEYIFYHAQQRAKRTVNEGATLASMLAALREDGQPAEGGWPYLTGTPVDPSRWKPPSGASPVFRRAGAPGADTVDAIIADLDQGQPVITLMRLSRSFYRPGPGGVVDAGPNEQPEFHRRHAVIALGHGTAPGQRVVLVRNSWGSGWGVSGYAWITEKFLRPRVFRLAKLMEDLSVSPSFAAA
ncbi:MAG: hypothetical protein QOF14_735 [Hyphomicrobiales bacterium]|jgi:hypothetical protein|nr:hypothetical protein [Hyphomicrobiales bacterium]